MTGQLSLRGTYLDPGFVQTKVSGELQLLSVLELSAGYELFTEREGGATDSVGIGQLGIGLQLGSEALGVRLTPGVHYLRFDDTPNGESGGELSARLEAFPGPVVIRFEGRTGVIGETTTRVAAFELGWRFRRAVEVHAGWGGRVLGDVQLLGPRAGLKFWL